MNLNGEQLQRYNRNILVKEIGTEGQKKLLDSSVLIIGLGGLGSPIAYYLAAAGIGKIGLADSDKVELGNLQRQILYRIGDIGRKKVGAAKINLENFNSDIEFVLYDERVTSANIRKIISAYDFIVEATDNFESKFMVNDACVEMGKPFSQSGVIRFSGQAMTYKPGSACYRCIFEGLPDESERAKIPTCSDSGVLGVTPGVLGTIQASETIKSILGIGETLINKVFMVDLLKNEFNIFNVERDPDCPVCGRR